MESGYSIALKFGTQKGDIMAHLGTKFGYNTINTRKVIRDYSRKITSICCHAHRVNCTWQEEFRGRLTIEPQTFCGLKKNRTKNHEDTAKKPTVCNNYAIENY